jgi:hypothetical protein
MLVPHLRRECLLHAVLAVAVGLAWQITLVYGLYGGNWSALFHHGVGGGGVPNEPAFANTYVFPVEWGYDGQYYRMIAHNPLLTRGGYVEHINLPLIRYHRILVPIMAFALAFGQQPYIDAGIIATLLLFLFLGVYWLARYAVLFGRSPKWGWAFFLAPATLSGLERGTIDIALGALTIGFALYLREQSRYRLFLVLVMAGLCRETGLFLCLACAGASFLKRNWTMMAWSCASMLPTLAWYGYTGAHVPRDPEINTFFRLPLKDLLSNLLHHDVSYVNSGRPLVQVMYYVAVLGMLLAFLFAIWFAFHAWTRAESLAALAFAIGGLLVQTPGLWMEAYGFGRILAPILVLLALQYFPTGDWRRVLPAFMVTPSILLVSAANALSLAKHLRM